MDPARMPTITPRDMVVAKYPCQDAFSPDIIDPHENQNERQAITQQMEPPKGTGQQKIHRAQAKNGEHIRRVDDQWLAGDGKDRRNGVEGEKNIGRLDERERQQNGRGVQFSVPPQEEPRPFGLGRHGQQPSQSSYDKAPFGLDLALRGKHHLEAGENQENAEEDHDPTVLEKRGSENAKDQRSQNAKKQNTVLQQSDNSEIAEN